MFIVNLNGLGNPIQVLLDSHFRYDNLDRGFSCHNNTKRLSATVCSQYNTLERCTHIMTDTRIRCKQCTNAQCTFELDKCLTFGILYHRFVSSSIVLNYQHHNSPIARVLSILRRLRHKVRKIVPSVVLDNTNSTSFRHTSWQTKDVMKSHFERYDI